MARKAQDEKEVNEKGVKKKTVNINKQPTQSIEDPKPEVNQRDELMDKYLRVLAEFDNFKKRTDKEKSGMYNNGVCDAILALLPVLDNFERALNAVEDKESSFYKGTDMIFRQFLETLEGLGIERIETAGEQFDHNLHFAVAHTEDENYGANVIIDELQKGYKLKDRIIRHSMVRVAN